EIDCLHHAHRIRRVRAAGRRDRLVRPDRAGVGDQQVRRKESLAAHSLNQPHRGGGGAAAGDDGGRVFELGSDDEEATRYFAGGVKPRLGRFAIACTGLRARVVYSRHFPETWLTWSARRSVSWRKFPKPRWRS